MSIIYRYPGPLIRASFVERTNRFVCKIQFDPIKPLQDVYCPNTGSMLNLVPTPAQPALPCWLSTAPAGSTRKYDKTLELVQDQDTVVGIQSRLANDMVHSALQQGLIPELRHWCSLRREVCVSASGPHAKGGKDKDSRTDFQLLWREPGGEGAGAGAAGAGAGAEAGAGTDAVGEAGAASPFDAFAYKAAPVLNTPVRASAVAGGGVPPSQEQKQAASADTDKHTPAGRVSTNMLLEVKSVTLAQDMHLPRGQRLSVFPDCVSDRASKHLRCLMDHVLADPVVNRAVVFFLVQRDDCDRFSPCHLDPKYTILLQQAVEAGVEVMAYAASMDTSSGNVKLGHRVTYVPHPLPEAHPALAAAAASAAAAAAGTGKARKKTKRSSPASGSAAEVEGKGKKPNKSSA